METNGAKDELDLLLSSRARPGVGLSQNGHWRKNKAEVVDSRSRDPRSGILRTLIL